jgi:hypothetical protein
MGNIWIFGALLLMLSICIADDCTDKVATLETELRAQDLKITILEANLNAKIEMENNKTRVMVAQTELNIKQDNDKSFTNLMKDIISFVEIQNSNMLYKLSVGVILVSMAIVSGSILVRIWK